jgi:hypothetical protein
MSNSERQAKFRARRKAEGLKRQDEWIAEGGGFAKSKKDHWPMMTKGQLDGVIKKAVKTFGDDEMFKEALYAEIAAYVEKAAARFEAYRDQEKKNNIQYKDFSGDL